MLFLTISPFSMCNRTPQIPALFRAKLKSARVGSVGFLGNTTDPFLDRLNQTTIDTDA